MKRFIWFLGAALALGAAACSNPQASEPAPAVPRAPVPAPASSRAVPADPPASPAMTEVLSVLTVEHEVDVRAQREGVVVELAREEGQAVRAGDLLGRLDDRSVQMEIEKARNDLLVAQNNVKYKEAEKKAKEASLRRQQQLRELGLSSEADLEQAEFNAKATAFEVQSWNAMVQSGQAEIHSLEIELEKTRLRAPFSGVVVRRYVRQGQNLAKEDPCFRVSQLGPLQVHFQVPETSGERPVRGAMVKLALVSDSAHALTARVVKMSPTVDAASGAYDVTAQLTGSGLADLRPGMAVRVFWPMQGSDRKH